MAQQVSDDAQVLKVLVIPEAPQAPLRVQSIIGDPANALRHLVGGPIHALALDAMPATLLVNELQMDPDTASPFNRRATTLVWSNDPFSEPETRRFAGTAVLLGPQEAGRQASVLDGHLEMLTQGGRFRLQVADRSRPGEWSTTPGVFPDWFAGAWAATAAHHLTDPDRLIRMVRETSPETLDRWATFASAFLIVQGSQPLRPESIASHYDVGELAQAISSSPLRVGTAMNYFGIFLVNLGDGVEKWLMIRDDAVYEIPPLKPFIASGEFAVLIRLLMDLDLR